MGWLRMLVAGALLVTPECKAACSVRVASELDRRSTLQDVAEPLVIRNKRSRARDGDSSAEFDAALLETTNGEATAALDHLMHERMGRLLNENAEGAQRRPVRCFGIQQDNGTRQLLAGLDTGVPRYCRGKLSLPWVCDEQTLDGIASIAL